MKVQERTVKRWFSPKISSTGRVVNKGYGSKMAAYRALAREVLFDEVFGRKEEFTYPCNEYTDYSYWNRPGFESVKGGAGAFKEAFSKAMFDFGFECDEGNGYEEPTSCCGEHIGFCAKKYNAWIINKARELMAQGDLGI